MVPFWLTLVWKWPINTDLIFYATALKHFSLQFWSGELYPRWLMNVNNGLGSPVFLFYGPLAFYAGSLFAFLGPVDPHGFARVGCVMWLGLFMAGITSYRWLTRHFSKTEAQKGALTYAGFPYLLTLLYFSFGVTEMLAIAIFPLLLEASDDLLKQSRTAVLKLSAAYALLAMTHLPSTVVFSLIPFFYIAVFAPPAQRWKYIALTILSAVWAIGLAAIYMLPLLANRSYVVSENFISGKFHYAENFYHMQALYGAAWIFLPLLGLYIELPAAMRRAASGQLGFWMIILLAWTFMVTPLSAPLWKALLPLQYLQFPFRFFTAVIPAVVFIVLSWLPACRSRSIYGFILAMTLVTVPWVSNQVMFFENSRVVSPFLKSDRIIAPEYDTRWMAKANISPYRIPDRLLNMDRIGFAEGRGQIDIVKWNPRYIMVDADVQSRDAKLTLHRFYFPGWIADSPAATVTESSGLLAITLPKGSHDITLTVPWFKGEREGLLISLVALLAWGCLYARLSSRIKAI